MAVSVGAQILKDSALAALELKAKSAADSHKFELADSLYLQALHKSQQLNLSAETIHITCQLVRARAINDKIVATDPQVESALESVKRSIQRGSYDPNCSVWLSDIADTYYWAGATALSVETTEADIRKYIEISSLIQGGFDPKLFERTFELISLLDREGRYEASLKALEDLRNYMNKVNPPVLAMSNLSYG